MPLFFFHVFDEDATFDPEGRELAGVDAAREVALREARLLICDSVMKGRVELRHRIEVHDEAGNAVAAVRYGDSIEIHE
jgi:hypothetical protein